jgi:hypothetical protein
LKSIDTHTRNLVSLRMALKQITDFCPVEFFVCFESSEQRQKTQPGKRKNTSHVFIDSV